MIPELQTSKSPQLKGVLTEQLGTRHTDYDNFSQEGIMSGVATPPGSEKGGKSGFKTTECRSESWESRSNPIVRD